MRPHHALRTALGAHGVMALSLAATALLSACTTPPPTSGAARTPSPQSSFEQQQLAQARAQTAQGHLAKAATHWEVLTVLRPHEPSYTQALTQVRAQIDHEASTELNAAKAARQRGAIDEAATRYLAVLGLQPDNVAAADALRAIEREHNQRDHLGRYARLTLGSRTNKDSKESLQAGSPAATALSAQRNDLEHAALLAGQGEFDDAITLLNQRLKARQQDTSAKELLADVYFAQAEALAPRDKDKAIAALRKCLQLQPRYAAARNRLAQLTSRP